MKSIGVTLLALVLGFIGGIVLTEIISIIAVTLFERPIWLRGLKYLPFITALASAMIVPVVLWNKAK